MVELCGHTEAGWRASSGTAFIQCDGCSHKGLERMPIPDMSKQQERELLEAVIEAWNTDPVRQNSIPEEIDEQPSFVY